MRQYIASLQLRVNKHEQHLAVVPLVHTIAKIRTLSS